MITDSHDFQGGTQYGAVTGGGNDFQGSPANDRGKFPKPADSFQSNIAWGMALAYPYQSNEGFAGGGLSPALSFQDYELQYEANPDVTPASISGLSLVTTSTTIRNSVEVPYTPTPPFTLPTSLPGPGDDTGSTAATGYYFRSNAPLAKVTVVFLKPCIPGKYQITYNSVSFATSISTLGTAYTTSGYGQMVPLTYGTYQHYAVSGSVKVLLATLEPGTQGVQLSSAIVDGVFDSVANGLAGVFYLMTVSTDISCDLSSMRWQNNNGTYFGGGSPDDDFFGPPDNPTATGTGVPPYDINWDWINLRGVPEPNPGVVFVLNGTWTSY